MITYLIDVNIEKNVPCYNCRRYTLPDKKVTFKRTGETHVMIQCMVGRCPFNGRNLSEGRVQFRGFAGRIFDEKKWRKVIPTKTIYDLIDEDLLDDGQSEMFLAPDFGDE